MELGEQKQGQDVGMHRHPHVLNAATNLLGVSFVIIGALKLSHSNARSYADEVAWASAGLFLISVVASYWAIRKNETSSLINTVADASFFLALLLLAASVVVAATIL
jgi:nicotinamide riboside transporter PnuC